MKSGNHPCHVEAYLDRNPPNRWVGRTVHVEYRTHSPCPTALRFSSREHSTNRVYIRERTGLDDLKATIEQRCSQHQTKCLPNL